MNQSQNALWTSITNPTLEKYLGLIGFPYKDFIIK